MRAGKINSVYQNFHFENRFVVDSNGIGGGLSLFWSSKINVSIKSYSLHHINAEVHNEGGKAWRCMRIYGHPKSSQKHHTWTLLKRLANHLSLPWCCFGDFNEVMHLSKKMRGLGKNINMITDFREAV